MLKTNKGINLEIKCTIHKICISEVDRIVSHIYYVLHRRKAASKHNLGGGRRGYEYIKHRLEVRVDTIAYHMIVPCHYHRRSVSYHLSSPTNHHLTNISTKDTPRVGRSILLFLNYYLILPSIVSYHHANIIHNDGVLMCISSTATL